MCENFADVFTSDEFNHGTFAPLFFVAYTLILNFILVNMFISVVNDSFGVVKARTIDQLNEYELVSFIWQKAKMLFGFAKPQVANADGPMYVEGNTGIIV